MKRVQNETVYNTFEQWVACKNRLEVLIQAQILNSGDIVVIEMTLEDHVENLIYFYPIVDMLHDAKVKCRLEITITKSDPAEAEDTQKRVEHFLFVQQLLRTKTKPVVTVNGSDEFHQTRFGDLQPLLSVALDKDDPFSYLHLYRSEIEFSLFEKVLDYYVTELFTGTESSKSQRQEIKRFIESNAWFYSMQFVQSNKKYFTQTTINHPKWGGLFEIKYNDTINVVYSKLILSNLFYSIKALSGIKGVINLQKDDKLALAREILSTFREVITDMPILAQYIWSLLLRYQLESKNLIVLEEAGMFYHSLFDTTLTQAQALAEGLYQLIENSCIHSKSGTGYYYLRVHETGLTNDKGSFDTVEKHVQTLQKLSKLYAPLELNGKTRFYVELRFVDNAFKNGGTEGMVDHFNRNVGSGKPVEDIKGLFWREPKSIDDLIVHYGLRVLERTVNMNKGALMVYTPSKDREEGGYAYRSVYGGRNESFDPEGSYYHGTVYHMLLPIEDELRHDKSEAGEVGEPLFSFLDWDEDYLPYLIKLEARPEYDEYEKKTEHVDEIFQRITTEAASMEDKDHRIISILPEGFRLNHMELLAKALIKYLLHHREEKNLIALLVSDRHRVNEFTRTYTAFFDRSGLNYEQHKLYDTQIAMCIIKEDEAHVSFVLSGNDLMIARKTVMNYLYYNSEHSVEFMPLVSYLTSFIENQNSKGTAESVFPFDLYLDIDAKEEYQNDKAIIDHEDTWFIKYIHKVLDTNMQTSGYGCKLTDVHVSLGSKIHTDTFYNAELLFHNYANVFRFAYLIARDVLREHMAAELPLKTSDRRNNIVMVAYGEYSLLLIQKVCDLIQCAGKNYTANYILFPSYLTPEEQRDWQTHGKEFMDFIEAENLTEGDGLSGYKFYVVVPISTTLITVRKIQDTLKRRARYEKLKGEPEFGITTSLIVSGGIADDSGVKLKYWKSVQSDNRLIVLEDGKKVRYYFNKNSVWYRTSFKDGCELCDVSGGKPRKSLIGVDKTSTLPDAIFDTLDRKKRIFDNYDPDKNTDRIQKIYGCVKYSHIAVDQNHFLYDIDYESYCRNPTTDDEIRKWLKEEVHPSIDANCFNIVVTPLHSSNSRFLKNVLECAFDSSSRVININFHSSYRDEIRSKLEFITEEYRRLKVNIRNIGVHVYYVDDCIIEGATYQRSKQFLYMLLAEAGLRMEKVSLYHGIILLSNRSSYDTIQNLLCQPLEKHFFYYLRLNVPSFNTKNRICPACALSDQYLLMRKRASTNVIAAEYSRLYHKHDAKSRFDYNEWINSLLKEEAYFSKLKTWLYYAVNYDERISQYYYVNIKGERRLLEPQAEVDYLTLFGHNFDRVLSGEKKLSFEDADDHQRTAAAKILRKHFLADKDYCRMVCTHEIFTALEAFHNKEVSETTSAKKYENNLRAEILSLLSRRLEKIDKECSVLPKQVQLWLKAEWTISYIKIISRKQPSQYYHLRNAMYNILIDWLDYMIEGRVCDDLTFLSKLCGLSEKQNMNNSIMPDMKYRIFLTIIRRLSAMQSSYLIQKLDRIIAFYDHYKQQYDGVRPYHHFFLGTESLAEIYHALVDFPKKDHFNLNIAKLIKWSAMNGIDDSKCFLAENRLKDLLMTSDAVKLAYLENTQVIYAGIKKLLMDDYSFDRKDREGVKNYVDAVLTDEAAFLKDEDTPMTNHHPYLEFTEFDTIADDADKRKVFAWKVTSMLTLFSVLCELEARSKPVDHPYDYVEVCNDIRNITGYKQCKIFSFRDHRASLIISSDIYRNYLLHDIPMDRFDELFTHFCESQISDYDINRVAQKYIVDKKEVMVVSLMAPHSSKDFPYASTYFLVLYRDILSGSAGKDAVKEDLTQEDLKRLRDFLFLRDRLEHVLDRDIANLISMISSYDYVTPLVEGRDPVVLHISDLHISETSKIDNYRLPFKTSDGMDKIKTKGQPDLLLITGDVIYGKYSAAGLQSTYENAEKTIKLIARALWRVSGDKDEKYVRSDWNKRILISVGNHDYASMNELEATNSKRITTAGKPGALGDVMIKHSYFVQFMHRLLGTDIDEIITYDLNQVVNYRRLGLSVLNLNSNSNVNPLRTNKVRVNGDEVRNMLRNVTLEKNMIYMIHHTPIYTIDYVDDVYYLKCDDDRLDVIKDVMEKAYRNSGLPFPATNVNRIWIRMLKSIVAQTEDAVYGLERKDQEELVKDILDLFRKWGKSENREDDYEDFRYYLTCRFGEREYDDKCRRIVYDLNEQIKASELDQQNYAEQACAHFQEHCSDGNEYIILGGHTHRAAQYTEILPKPMSACKGIYEASKFVHPETGSDAPNYYVFSVGEEKKMLYYGGDAPVVKSIEGSILEQITEIAKKAADGSSV